jgi:hypothetical protein
MNSRVAALLILALSPSVSAADIPLGTYSTVSESEWQLYVELKAGGVAEIRHETWEPGQYKEKQINRTKAKWSSVGNRLSLSYGGVTDTFEFTLALSLKELGLSGGAPGLRQIDPVSTASQIAKHSLWLEPHKLGQTQ